MVMKMSAQPEMKLTVAYFNKLLELSTVNKFQTQGQFNKNL